jgi:hypothetical protein
LPQGRKRFPGFLDKFLHIPRWAVFLLIPN